MIFEFRNVTKYGRHRAVGAKRDMLFSDLSFAMPARLMTLGILGDRYKGKSTLINLIVGAEYPDQGQVIRTGRVSFPVGTSAVLHGHLSAQEASAFIARVHGLNTATFNRSVLELTELGPHFGRKISALTAVEKTRLRYALTYLVPFDCYVGDGPPLSGDPVFMERCAPLIAERKKTSAFFFVSRVPRDIKAHADMAGVIENGRIMIYPDVDSAIAAFRQQMATDPVPLPAGRDAETSDDELSYDSV